MAYRTKQEVERALRVSANRHPAMKRWPPSSSGIPACWRRGRMRRQRSRARRLLHSERRRGANFWQSALAIVDSRGHELMAVYVDNMEAMYRGMKMCHMIADTPEELLRMADAIGVSRRHVQFPGSYREHFDNCKSKRRLAVRQGAREITVREMALIWRARRERARQQERWKK